MPRRTADQRSTTIYLSSSQHRELKVEAAERGMTITQIVLEALRLRVVNRLALHDPDPSAR